MIIQAALTLSPPNKLSSAKFLFCFNFQTALLRLKVGEMLFEHQTARIRMRRRVTRRLIRIQAVCIWHYSCAWRAKGQFESCGLIKRYAKSCHFLFKEK